jgi:hypothetical protein
MSSNAMKTTEKMEGYTLAQILRRFYEKFTRAERRIAMDTLSLLTSAIRETPCSTNWS